MDCEICQDKRYVISRNNDSLVVPCMTCLANKKPLDSYINQLLETDSVNSLSQELIVINSSKRKEYKYVPKEVVMRYEQQKKPLEIIMEDGIYVAKDLDDVERVLTMINIYNKIVPSKDNIVAFPFHKSIINKGQQ